ncbi:MULTISPECIES: hypothetical protein [Photorhabdus]|uniref:hypothetical protein n=1 Tax=Photorhabdus TaxID=29487 RepID=UPI000DCE1BB6|nr:MULTISPECIES: hypothetical protein [Photorhabdus]MCT8343279.1 hypothetical protein [Photorhabdus kleinii]RAW98027.1 hypothetical protein CKY05_12705 [Photorhabdus sp. S10-54]RAW98135.1 hypothetical protein CKY03_12230 [Photorhabdus sp. S9-53]RAX02347.1 hypothetical protein CKY04_12790 [Photorhabdus sp. S8-52]
MNENSENYFIWYPDRDQTYTEEYGSSRIPPIYSFNKEIGTTFTMDAGENTLILSFDKNARPSDYNIRWPILRPLQTAQDNPDNKILSKTIKILSGNLIISGKPIISGNLIISGKKEKSVNFYLNSEILGGYGHRIELQNSSTFKIENAGIVRISNHINTKLRESTVVMSGISRLTVEPVEKTQENNEVLESNISLNCDFSITEFSKAMLKSHHVHIDGGSIILQDNAKMLISSQVLNIRTDLDEKGCPLFDTNFTLKAGATLLNLNSIDGIHFPLDIHRENYPKGVFNFMAEGKENTGKVVIDVAPKDANAYGLNTLLRKNFTAINGKVVETGDQMKYFDFNYGKDIRNGNQVGTITISLIDPNLRLS